ncbi:MAG TPA: hypothetical protein DHV28_06475 [Ignavibacteriales bacterium]|nr:hypothetical protein [Ignavibacteriales bacterium]
MTGIQSLLAIGAIWLFALISINFNSTVVHNISIEVENKVYLTAFSLADDMIEEIKQKAFDERTIDFITPNAEQLTLDLGTEGEVWPNFNDVDDYNGYSKNVGLPYLETYHVSTAVFYVNSNDPNSVAADGERTFYKKVEVTVTSKYMSLPVVLSFIFTMK